MKHKRVWATHILLVLGFGVTAYGKPVPQDTASIERRIDDIWQRRFKGRHIPAAPFQAVTTGIKDHYPIASWLDRYPQVVGPQDTNTLTLPPGYYRVTVRSYCLHAGAYGPTQGVGYLLAPLKGTATDLITHILKSSEIHVEIAQQNVQQLIWGIEAGVKFSQYSEEFRARVLPLLTPEDLAKMELVTFLGSLQLNVPRDLVELTKFFDQFRGMLTNPEVSYAQLEHTAVLTGSPPLGTGSLDYPIGPWAYAQQQGFYVREVGHNGYQATTLEILRPGAYVIERDTQGRIRRLDSDSGSLVIGYRAQLAGQPASGPGWPAARTSPLRSLKLAILPRSGTASAVSRAALTGAVSLPSNWMSALGQISQYGQAINRTVASGDAQSAQDLADLSGLLDTLGSAPALHAKSIEAPAFRAASFSTTPQSALAAADAPPLRQAQEVVLDAWVFAACVYLGQCNAGPQVASSIATPPEKLELAGQVQSPANTSMQRLAQSSCPPGNNCPGAAPVVTGIPAVFGFSVGQDQGAPESVARAGIRVSVNPGVVVPGGEAKVSGLVQDAYGDPIPGATVQLTAAATGRNPMRSTLTTDADGNFSSIFIAPPNAGTVTFRATMMGSSPLLSTIATLNVRGGNEKLPDTKPPADSSSMEGTSQATNLVNGTIHDVDFRNFIYPTNCSKEFEIGKTVHVRNGEWNNGDVTHFAVEKVIYGDLKQDGKDEAVVLTGCSGQTNFGYSELFVYAKSSHSVERLINLSPSDWGEGEENNGGDFPVTAFSINNHQLAVSFPAGGSHACAAWTVTKSFQWNGTRFVSAGKPDRKPNQCQ
jgi:hypothetical protein